MLKKLFSALFKGRRIEVPKTSEIADGEARNLSLGDLAAGGQRLVICRVGGKLHALDSKCPHEGGRISAGRLFDGKYAICPLHNYLFDPKDGAVIRGACRKATTFKIEEKDGNGTLFL
jgi:nitrite reductase/ring-hydroxylating ferredoxin subunit